MTGIGRRSLLASGIGAFGGFALGCQAREVPRGAAPRLASLARLSYLFPAVATQEGRGALVHRIFPTRHLRNLDPFVLLDDFSVAEPAGFPEHPHRGFEAFTYMLEGAFEHKDNLGNESVVLAGGTQRFTSGAGARHSEVPYGRRENRGLQLWVNLARAEKTIAPSYAPTEGHEHPVSEGGGVLARTIVGQNSPVALRTRVDYVDLELERGRSAHFDVREGDASLLYAMRGHLRIVDSVLPERFAALTTPGALEITATTDARVLVLTGTPHHEPIVQRGPFVD